MQYTFFFVSFSKVCIYLEQPGCYGIEHRLFHSILQFCPQETGENKIIIGTLLYSLRRFYHLNVYKVS